MNNLVSLIKHGQTIDRGKIITEKKLSLGQLDNLKIEGGISFTEFHKTKKALEKDK